MEKKFTCSICQGQRKNGVLPRYVSSAEIVGNDIVIHTSDEPVPISSDLAHGSGLVFSVAADQNKYRSYVISQAFIFGVSDSPVQEVSGDE